MSINHMQQKQLEQCVKRRLSVEDTLDVMKLQRSVCIKMLEHSKTVFARKTVKKSVMTVTSYGATQMTSRSDVIAQINAAEPDFLGSLTPSEVTMLTNMVFWSMEAGVPSAMRFLGYFRKLLAFVLKYCDEITFRNPLTGFPICLKVYDEESQAFQYKVHGKASKAKISVKLHSTNKRKTTSSSVPGIIHSIDAAILTMIKTGLDINDMAYVHDSVAVHPNNLLKAKQSVAASLVQVLEGDVFQNIVDQLLEGIENVPVNLRTAPREDTWTDYNTDDWYYSYS